MQVSRLTKYQGLGHEYLVRIIYFSILLSTTAFFLAENGRANAFPTYLLAIGVLAYLVIKRPANASGLPGNVPLAGALVLILYLSVTTLWSDNRNITSLITYFGYGTIVGSFVIGMLLCYRRFPNFIPMLALAIFIAGTLSAGLSVFLFYEFPEYRFMPGSRMIALGRLSNPVIAADSYGFAIVLGLYILLQQVGIWRRLLIAMAITLLLYATVLTGSRAVWLAIAFAASVGVASRDMSYKYLAFGLVLVVFGAMALLVLDIDELTRRALSFRPEIWSEYTRRTITGNLWFGAGSSSDSSWPTSAYTFDHPHSIFVSVLYFGGVAGLVLIVSLYMRCLFELGRLPFSNLRSLALMSIVFGIILGMFDGDNPLTKIDFHWWMVWLPITFCICAVDGLEQQK